MLRTQVDLQPYNTFGIQVHADHFSTFTSLEELRDLLANRPKGPLLVLGGGSNVLFRKDFSGTVLRNELNGIATVAEDENHVFVEAQAGEVWHDFVLYAIEKGYGGIENLSLIPGSVGAAPMQNIGAYGVEIKDVFHSLKAFHISSGEIHEFDAKQCEFGYRESVFKRRHKGEYIILSMILRLSKKPQLNTSYGAIEKQLETMGVSQPTIKDISDAVIHIRQTKLPNPAEIGNAGSFFKNPVISQSAFETLHARFPDVAHYRVDEQRVKLAAGWLIDQAGWKGKTLGQYGVHKNQALVLVNYGGANGSDIYALSEEILQSVKERYGVELEREVNIL